MVSRDRKTMEKLFNAVKQARREIACEPRSSSMSFEELETRRLMTLLGIAPDVPAIFYNQTGQLHYNATSDALDITATALAYFDPFFNVSDVDSGSVAVHFVVDGSGNLVGGVPGDDLVVTGNIDTDGDTVFDYTGVLLTAEVTAFGHDNAGPTDNYDIRFMVTGGALQSLFAGMDLGMLVESENSTFTGSFAANFDGGAKGTMGAIPLLPPPVTAGISGVKYTDQTNNGITGDDTPLGGVTINLYKDNGDGILTGADGAAIASTVTAVGTGTYSFTGLEPGAYLVQEIVPAGYQQSVPGSGTYLVALNGTDVTGRDFANAKLTSISGAKYLDVTGNGPSGDDTGFGGVTINLFKDNDNSGTLTGGDGAAIASTSSAAGTGAYSFGGLLPGTYFVTETVPAGYQQSSPTGTGYFTVVQTITDASGKNFYNKVIPPVTGSISGNKYLDKTGNGLTLSDDTGFGGVTIKLFKDVNNDGLLTAADGAAVATTVTTAGTGAYNFAGLAAGNYFVQEVVPTGYVRTAPTLTDKYLVTLGAGQNATGKNFANAEIHDCADDIKNVKYYVNGCLVDDLRGNTHQENVVKVTFTVKAGVSPEKFTLVAYKASSPVFIAADADEQYIFDIDSGTFGPGTYTLCVTLPDSYYQVDFVCGCAIDRFGPAGSNIFYSAQKRLLSADNAGSNSDIDGLSKGPKYWASTAGQNLIKGLNGGINSTQLATWMKNTFPKLYGAQAGSYNLTGKTNAQVAANILSLYNGGSTKLATAQAMSIAISMWVSTISQGGNTADIQAAGFRPTAGGLAPAIFNVLNDGAAFDESNNSNQTVLELMKDCNDNAVNGLLYANDSSMRNSALDVLEAITNNGDIDTP